MKYIIKIFIILIISLSGYKNGIAQKFNSFAGIRLGFALPMGQFASHEYGTGGYALLGKCIGLEAAWFMNPKIGIGANISANTFGFATGYYADDMKENSPELESEVDMLSGPYSIKTFMGGGYYRLKIANKLFSTFKLMGGLHTAKAPDQFHGAQIYLVGKNYWWKTGSLDRSFGFLTGATLEYKIYTNVDLLIQADFTYAQAAFVYEHGQDLYTENIKMPVFKLQPGINIRF